MKKLLITTMAAVSVGLCAKADYDGTKTSFEDYNAGEVLSVNGNTVWSTKAATDCFVISNLTDFANQTKPSRPDHWGETQSLDTKALTIDTDEPLFCDVNTRSAAYEFSDGPIFFDSVVQFTATDVAAEPDSADKLRVWLYTSPDDVSGTNLGLFDETSRKTCLVVTAGKYDGDLSTSNLNAEHYEVQIEGVEIQPDTWHRLTIKAIADIDPRADFYTPAFEIWVDGKPVTYGADKKTQFPSLKRGVVNETLQCVAFDGKGAVDDIVFTTTDPFALVTYTVQTTINDVDGAAYTKQYSVDGGSLYTDFAANGSSPFVENLLIPQTVQNIKFKFLVSPGYKVEGATKTTQTGDVDGEIWSYWEKQIAVSSISFTDNVGAITLNVVPGEEVTYPTVKPNGDSTTQETLSTSAAEAIKAALEGVETMPAALTVIVNEKEYFGDEAVAKINEVVAMFKAAKEGETLKFFNNKGEMIVSFKAKNPLMETETAEATDYEAMVGESAATVTSDYTVNKETVDLTPGVAGENEAVTFKLVIKPVGSTGSDAGSAVQE